MKIAELIAEVDKLRPNGYDNKQKARWLTEIEGTVIEEILNMAEGNNIDFSGYQYDEDKEKELLIPIRFNDVYINYLLAKIDFHDSETSNYNNDVIAFQAAYDQYAAWYRRCNMPKQPASFHRF